MVILFTIILNKYKKKILVSRIWHKKNIVTIDRMILKPTHCIMGMLIKRDIFRKLMVKYQLPELTSKLVKYIHS